MTAKVVTSAFALLLTATLSHDSLAGGAIVDDFESEKINHKIWSLIHMPIKRHWIDSRQMRAGRGALAIRVKGYDLDKRCNCQVSEIREANKIRINFGDEIWYKFSFRINGGSGNATASRWQITGWKQETDGSPFLSQRMDNGVFHITLESDKSRVLLATAQGEADGFVSAMAKGLMSQFGYLTETEKYDGKDNVEITYGKDPILPNPRKGWVDMTYHIKGGLNGDGFVEIFANGRFIAKATGTIGVKEFAGKTQYFRFGHNRAAMPGTATLFLDSFSRAKTRKELGKPNSY